MTIIILFDDLLFNNKSRICLSKTRGETHIMITYTTNSWSNEVNIGVWTWNLVGGVNCWRLKNWRSLQGHQGSSKVKWGKTGYTLIYGHETWWVGSIIGSQNFEGHFKVIRGHPEVNEVKLGTHWCMDLKLGGWGQLRTPKMLTLLRGHQGSSKVK